jgi:glycosyltransferase involved in cell wall biosynthesis
MLMEGSERLRFKILHCSIALTFGGEQKQLGKVLSYLDSKYFLSIVCCIRRFGYVEQKIWDLANKFICLRIGSRYNLPEEVWKLRQVVKEHDIDLIVTGIFGSDFSPLLTALITRIPVVAFLTTTYDLKDRAAAGNSGFVFYWKSRVFYLVHAILARLAKVHYIALSETIKESAIKNLHLPSERISVVPIGIDPDQFDHTLFARDTTARLKNELGLNGAYPILLNVARLTAVKGQKDLLEIMPQILRRFPYAKLLIAGDGTTQFKQELTNLRDHLNLQQNVQLLGHRDDIADLLNISDMFVFSSYYEGLPGSVIEAMAASKPVVAFDIPSIRELVTDGNTGILVRQRDIGLLAESVIHLAEHPDIAKDMGEQARRIVQSDFDIRQNIKELEKIFKRILVHPSVQDKN